MKGKKIIDDATSAWGTPGLDPNNLVLATHAKLLEIHARALACHCECLGMNAENCQAAMLGRGPVYSDDSYLVCMVKWGLINEKYEPTI